MKMPESIFVNGFQPSGGSTIELLGKRGTLKWKADGATGFRIFIPSAARNNPPCKHAWTFRILMNNIDR